MLFPLALSLCVAAAAGGPTALASDVPQPARGGGVAPLLTLNDGHSVPALGLGTWLGLNGKGGRVEVTDDSVTRAVETAIDLGYRHIDTAWIYNTEEQVGKAVNKKIQEGVVKREDLFITTKLWNTFHARAAVVPALRESLRRLGLEYVDLYLIHWPVGLHANGSFDNTDYLETWAGMVEAKAQGLTRSIGVSNFNQQMMERLIRESSVKPAMLQVELNLNLQQPSLLSYCRGAGVAVTGYTPLGSLPPGKAAPGAPPPRVDDPPLVAIAQAHNKTSAQVALRYLVELGVIPIPKSVSPSRLSENLAVFDFALSPAERATLRGYDVNYRTIAVTHFLPSPYYPFERPH